MQNVEYADEMLTQSPLAELFLQKLFGNKFANLLLIGYLCVMKSMDCKSGEIRVVYKTPQFESFYNSLPSKVQTKFKYVLTNPIS